MNLNAIAKALIDECWEFKAYYEQDSDLIPVYVVKLSCGVQARGHYYFKANNLLEAFENAYQYSQGEKGK